MATPAAVLSILVKTQGAQAAAGQLSALDKSGRNAAGGIGKAEGAARRSSKTFSVMGSAAKSAGVLVGAAGLAKGLSTAVSEYREAQKTGAQTTAVLKSTGEAAKVTAKHIQDLAGSISKKSGIDDEQIQQSENMLLTFTKLRNETGKGNKIFDQATQTVTDMSVALGQSGKSSAIQLGKALNDPIKGITALRRVGVSFTADQQKQITTLENTGHHLEAQKIILRELRTKFGGSAAAQATAGDKFKVSLSNLAEAAGAILVPALDKVMVFLTKFMDQMVRGVGVGGALISKFKEFGGALAPLGQSIAQIAGWLQKNQGVSKALAIGIGILTGAIIALNLAMSANPFVLAGIAIAALVVGVVTAYREFETFRKVVDTVVGAIKTALPTIIAVARTVVAAFVAVFRAVWPTIKKIFEGGITALKAIVIGGARILSGAVEVIKGVLHGDFTEIWDGIKKIFSGGFTAVKGIITGAAEGVRAVAKGIGTAIVKGIGDGLSMLGHFLLEKFKDAARFVIDNIKGAFSGVGKAITGAIGKINPFGDGVGKLPKSGGGGSSALMGANSALKPFASIGSRFGLRVSSGRRPGSITSSGNVSYHSTGEAIDEAGSPAGMMGFFKFMKSNYGGQLAELIYGPGKVGIKNGRPFNFGSALNAQHMDHVHVAFDTGKPGVGDGIGDVPRLARGAGFKGDALITAIAVAGAESGFRSKASNRNTDGSIDRGYWQINSIHGNQSTFNPTANARAAYQISSGGRNWHPWVTYNTGAYQRYLNQARAAAGSISGSATKTRTGGATSAAGSGAASVAAKVNPLDQKLAAADLSIQQAQTGAKATRTFQKVAAMVAKRKLIGKRIQSIRKALKGRLSPTKRLALTQELTQRLSEHAQLGSDIRDLVHPAATATDTSASGGGIGDTGGAADDGETDAQKQAREATEALTQALVDHMNALQSLQDEVSKQNQFAVDVRTVQMGQLAKGLADFISGQIGGYGGVTGRSLTAGAGTVVRY